jgi:VanZ family protein
MMINGLKFFPSWRALGYGLILLVIYFIENGDKLGHWMAYTTLMVWFAWPYPNLRTRLVYAAGFLVLGIALEFAQGFTEHRTFELSDMVADTVGIALGWIAALLPLPNLLVLTERSLFKVNV